jgi:nitrogenase molybdenum-iron protein NifN
VAEIINHKKPLVVSPLKVSSTVGAALAFLGMNRSMPLMHGSQGCTAFAKVFFVRHFREPVPLQTTAMDQISSVMGADDNIVEALRLICDKNNPAIIGLVTTGLAETQGCDIRGAVKAFREEYQEFKHNHVVAVNTPDFTGSFESGFALAVTGIIKTLIADDRQRVGLYPRQVNVLCHANLTPSDMEYITETLEDFQLCALLIPDLSGSLDGHLEEGDFDPLTTGGLSIEALQSANDSIATLVIGESLKAAAEQMWKKTAVPNFFFSSLMGLQEVDRWLMILAQISGHTVPDKYLKQRKQLQDAMLDTHFMLSDSRMAIAGDPDLVLGFNQALLQVGAQVVAAVVPAKGPSLNHPSFTQVCIGDLADLEQLALEGKAQLLIANSHAAHTAERLNIPLLRAGFPQYDLIGGFCRCWFGYRGTRQLYFDLANLIVNHHHGIAPYHSIYSQKDQAQSLPSHAALETARGPVEQGMESH